MRVSASSVSAAGLAPFAVSMLDQAHAEFCACRGLVTVPAAQVQISESDDLLGRYSAAQVASPNDISTASWIATNLSARTATTGTASVDGAPVYHLVMQTVPGVNWGRPTTIACTVVPGTSRYQAIYFAGGLFAWMIDTVGGTIVTTYGGVNGSYDAVSHAFSVTIPGATYTTGTSALATFPSSGAAFANTTYQGNGETFGWTNISVTQPISILQTTAANRPALEQDSAGRFRQFYDGVNDATAGAIAGLVSPVTVLWCGKFSAAYAASEYVFDAMTTNGMALYRSAAGQLTVRSAGTTFSTDGCDELNLHSWTAVFRSGGTGELWRDGVRLNSGTIGTLTADGLTLGRQGGTTAWPGPGYHFANAIIDGVLADCYHARYANMAAKRFGAAHA